MVKTTEENVSTKLQIPVDWKSLFDGTRKREIEYFIPGIAPMGAVTCIYGGAKQGKSLFVLNAVINVVLEKKFLGNQCQGRRVAYLDFENSAALHVRTRIEDMGFARHDLDDLVYFEHQWFDDFDSQKGGQQLLKIMKDYSCEAIVIDTSMRRLRGANDSSDTINAFYRFTLEPLTAAGYGVVLIEHTGKDATRGMIGSSQKAAVADCVWQYKKTTNNYRLVLDVSRHPICQPVLEFVLHKNPTRYAMLKSGMSNMDICIEYLDSIEAPFEVSQNAIARILRDGGYSIGNGDIGKLVEMRNKRRDHFMADTEALQVYEECFGDDIIEDFPDHEWEWPSEN
jgi:KaiC/GvpD/RAD55 family RecA-like ATPase